MNLNDCDCVILCGGMGKRLRSVVSDMPKVMAEVKGRPFMDYIIEYLKFQGVRRIVLCTGYMAEKIEDYYRKHDFGLTVDFSREAEPLGTGGAIKNAREIVHSDPFFVLNGDSFMMVDLNALLSFHTARQSVATLTVSTAEESSDFGSLTMNTRSQIDSFHEKSDKIKDAFVNAGVYCMDQKVFDLMPETRAFSLEKDFFPTMINRGFYGFQVDQEFIDIGTPERFASVKDKLK